MSQFTKAFLLTLIVATVAFASEHSGSPPSTAPAGPVPLPEVRSRGIAGELGVPLGTLVTVHTVVVSGDELKTRAAARKLFVRVDRVEGQPLSPPPLLELWLHPFAKEKLVQPVAGQVLTFTGWETGGYAGIVPREFDYARLYASTPYAFRAYFTAVRISR